MQVTEDVQSSTADLRIITGGLRMVLMPAKDQLSRGNVYPMLMNFPFWEVPSRLRLDSRIGYQMVLLPRPRFYKRLLLPEKKPVKPAPEVHPQTPRGTME